MSETRGHAKYSASGIYRWSACPGQMKLQQDLLDAGKIAPGGSSSYADRGSACHWIAEQVFLHGGMPEQYVDEAEQRFKLEAPLDEEDLESVYLFTRYVDTQCAPGVEKVVECRFDLEELHPDCGGTSDIVLHRFPDMLHVIDYKHGAGVPVDVENNLQLMCYALGSINAVCKSLNLDREILGWGGVFKAVTVTIVQPRCRHADGPVRSWAIESSLLDRFAEDLKAAITRTQDPTSPLVPGDHCRFCPCQVYCPAVFEQTQSLVGQDFNAESEIDLSQVDKYSNEQLARVMSFAPVIKSWLDAVSAAAESRLMAGEDVPGFKLVHKRANRKWHDETTAAETLRKYLPENDLFELRSPAQVEKALKLTGDSKLVEGLVVRPETGLTLVPEHDKRPAVPIPNFFP